MNMIMKLMKGKFFVTIIFTFSIINICFSQTGTFNATFTPTDSRGKTVSISFSKPVFKFDNAHGYWFVNPHNADRYFHIQPDANYGNDPATANGIAFITINDKENDFDFYSLTHDSSEVILQKGDLIISAPEYDPKLRDKNKPMHIHVNSISASEISFTVSGVASLQSNKGNGQQLGLGTISGSGHFYREAKYDKSETLPGCDCDPTIYAKVYDPENNVRTTSACEMALNNKIFDAVQKAMAPLFTNFAFKGSGKMSAGNISITIMPNHKNINVPVKERPFCSSDYQHNVLTAIDAHKKLFTDDNSYGLRFIQMPSDATYNKPADMTALDQQLKNKQITPQQYLQAMKEASDKQKNSGTAVDVKKEEAENNLYITVIINPATIQKISSKTPSSPAIKDAAFQTFSPMTKDGDGNWTDNKLTVYLGKYDTKTNSLVYPTNANKLSVYNVIINLSGGKDLIDKAMANMDLSAINALISKQ